MPSEPDTVASIAPVDEGGVDLLSCDTLAMILSHLDAYALCRVSTVSTTWRQVCKGDDLWGVLARARWNLADRGNKRYKYGERSWREVYRVFHRRNRIPITAGVGQREVVYASGREQRVCCWLLVNHRPACRLAARDDGTSSLDCRIVVQNLRASAIQIDAASGIEIVWRNGGVSRGMITESAHEGLSKLLTTDEVVPRKGPHAAGGIVVAPLQTMVFSVSFPCPPPMRFEPDALEACHKLHCGIALPPTSPHGGARIGSVPCTFVSEGTIWEHYELITRDFYTHVDHENN